MKATTRQIYATMLVGILGIMLSPERAVAGVLELSGIVQDPHGQPIPEAIVSVVSIRTRNKPVYTDSEGHFLATVFLPVDPGSFLEIYWNEELMFRQPLNKLQFEDAAGFDSRRTQILQSGGFLRLQPIRVGLKGG
jgi:hypothetical protein